MAGPRAGAAIIPQKSASKKSAATVSSTKVPSKISATEEGDGEEECEKYLVAVSKRGKVSRLHLAHGCWRAKARRFLDFEMVAEDPPGASMFTGYCRDCWPICHRGLQRRRDPPRLLPVRPRLLPRERHDRFVGAGVREGLSEIAVGQRRWQNMIGAVPPESASRCTGRVFILLDL